MQAPIKCKKKDISYKCSAGHKGNDVVRNEQQEKDYSDRVKKGKRIYPEDNGDQQQATDLALHTPSQNMGPAGSMDIEHAMQQPDYFNLSGKPRYVDPRLIPVEQFDPVNDVQPDSSAILYGIRRTGKSFFMDWYYSNWAPYYQQFFVFTKTTVNGFWQRRVPPAAIYKDLEDSDLQSILDFQQKVKTDPAWAQREGYDGRTGVLFDDVIDDNYVRHYGDKGALASLFVQGRHLSCSVMLATQFPTAVPPKCRDNVDMVVFFKTSKNSSMERFHDEYMGRLNRKTAMELINMYTDVQQYGTANERRRVLIVLMDAGLTYNQRFRGAVPQKPQDYTLGSEKFWKEMSG